jgi:hypothetical protein
MQAFWFDSAAGPEHHPVDECAKHGGKPTQFYL